MKCFGVAHHTPEQLLSWMLSKRIIASVSEVAIIPSSAPLRRRRPTRQFLLATSFDGLSRNLMLLNSPMYDGVIVFALVSPILLSGLSHMAALDYARNELNPVVFDAHGLDYYKYREHVRSEQHALTSKKIDFLKELTDMVKVGSLLNPLMTFIYTLPSATHQTPIKELCARYLYYGYSKSRLVSLFDSLPIQVSDRVRFRLFEILDSNIGENYKHALSIYRSSGLGKAKKSKDVNAYELSYLIAIAESSK